MNFFIALFNQFYFSCRKIKWKSFYVFLALIIHALQGFREKSFISLKKLNFKYPAKRSVSIKKQKKDDKQKYFAKKLKDKSWLFPLFLVEFYGNI